MHRSDVNPITLIDALIPKMIENTQKMQDGIIKSWWNVHQFKRRCQEHLLRKCEVNSSSGLGGDAEHTHGYTEHVRAIRI